MYLCTQNHHLIHTTRMKRLIIVFFLILIKCHLLFSQEENLVVFFTDAVTNSVPVYSSDTTIVSFTTVKEDPEKENWHEVEILGQSDNRYQVRITAINEENVAPINGWVDKEQCGVWFWGRLIKPEYCVVSLYYKPEQSNPFIKISDKYPDSFDKYAITNSKAFPVLDYKLFKGEYWIKTTIVKGKKKIVGWTTNYCPNIYGSCN